MNKSNQKFVRNLFFLANAGCQLVVGQDVIGEYLCIKTLGKTQYDADNNWVGHMNYAKYFNIPNVLFNFNFIFMNNDFGYSFSHIRDPDNDDMTIMVYFKHKLYLMKKCYELRCDDSDDNHWIVDFDDKDNKRTKFTINKETLSSDVQEFIDISDSKFFRNI
jgi:hypothetical protein